MNTIKLRTQICIGQGHYFIYVLLHQNHCMSCKCNQITIPEVQFTLWTHAWSTHNTHAQVGVYHVHSRTHHRLALNTKPPRWSSPTPPQYTLSVRTQRHSQSTTQPPLLHSRAEKKITRSIDLFSNRKNNADRLHGYSRISLTSTIERVARDIYFDHNIYDIVIN